MIFSCSGFIKRLRPFQTEARLAILLIWVGFGGWKNRKDLSVKMPVLVIKYFFSLTGLIAISSEAKNVFDESTSSRLIFFLSGFCLSLVFSVFIFFCNWHLPLQ